jgi:predicted RNase H-like HicB family nuclease
MFPFYTRFMRNEFTAVIERDNDWFVAWSPEIPGANGQGGAWKSAVRARPLRFN